ncbi:MAG TPA: hypothetical protein VMY76_01790 [Gemmatimonadales bacterium]|nr:hypothetical protein [Gemmatimonadales bacterium]
MAAVFWLQPYTADFPGTEYARPARQYLRAAIRRDSGDLQGMAATPAAVDWALQAGRTHPDSLAAWSGRTHTYVTARRADTADVLVYPAAGPCSEVPIVLRFTGSGSHARVVEARSACLPTPR